MSSGEIVQIYSTLQEILVLLNNVQIKTETLRVESVHTVGEVRELEYIFYRVTSLMGRMGLPPEIDKAISQIQRMILIMRMMQTTMTLLMASTPYGLVYATLTLASVLITAQDIGR